MEETTRVPTIEEIAEKVKEHEKALTKIVWILIVFMLATFLLALVTLPAKAHAAEAPQLIPRVQVGEAWGISIPNGSTTVNSTAPATLFGLGTALRLNGEWSLVTDLILVVPRAKFYPGFRPVVGMARKFNGWSLAGTLMYQLNPAYADGSKVAHFIGATVGPGIPLAATGTTLSFGVGYRAQFTAGKVNHIFAFGPTLVFSF